MSDIDTRILMSLEAIGRAVTPAELKARGQLRYGEDLLRQTLDRLVNSGQARAVEGGRYAIPGTTDNPPPRAPDPGKGITERIMEAVTERGPLRGNEIRAATGLTSKQVTSNLHHLVAKERLVRGEDRRYSIPPDGDRRGPDRHWTAEEDAIITRGATVNDTLQFLAEAGSHRTAKAVEERRKRLKKPPPAPATKPRAPAPPDDHTPETPMPNDSPPPTGTLAATAKEPPFFVVSAELTALERRITAPAPNPWVWVLTFERIRGNVDDVMANLSENLEVAGRGATL